MSSEPLIIDPPHPQRPASESNTYTIEELAVHQDPKEDLWVAIKARDSEVYKVYDMSKFSHPGGNQIIENLRGCNATDFYISPCRDPGIDQHPDVKTLGIIDPESLTDEWLMGSSSTEMAIAAGTDRMIAPVAVMTATSEELMGGCEQEKEGGEERVGALDGEQGGWEGGGDVRRSKRLRERREVIVVQEEEEGPRKKARRERVPKKQVQEKEKAVPVPRKGRGRLKKVAVKPQPEPEPKRKLRAPKKVRSPKVSEASPTTKKDESHAAEQLEILAKAPLNPKSSQSPSLGRLGMKAGADIARFPAQVQRLLLETVDKPRADHLRDLELGNGQVYPGMVGCGGMFSCGGVFRAAITEDESEPKLKKEKKEE